MDAAALAIDDDHIQPFQSRPADPTEPLPLSAKTLKFPVIQPIAFHVAVNRLDVVASRPSDSLPAHSHALSPARKQILHLPAKGIATNHPEAPINQPPMTPDSPRSRTAQAVALSPTSMGHKPVSTDICRRKIAFPIPIQAKSPTTPIRAELGETTRPPIIPVHLHPILRIITKPPIVHCKTIGGLLPFNHLNELTASKDCAYCMRSKIPLP